MEFKSQTRIEAVEEPRRDEGLASQLDLYPRASLSGRAPSLTRWEMRFKSFNVVLRNTGHGV